MFHNIWYSTMGVVQWTAWEVCFMHAYATGKLPYVSDAEVMSSPIEMVRQLAAEEKNRAANDRLQAWCFLGARLPMNTGGAERAV